MTVGIDIGSKTIKIVELQKDGNSFSLVSSGIASYSERPIDKIEDEKELSAISAVIKKLHKETRITKRNVGISLPENAVFTRTIKFPLLTDQEIASAVKWEAEQYIPIPISDAVVQHKIIERSETTSPPSVLVLLIAAPNALVEKYVRLFQIAGLTVDFVESELLALVRSLAPDKQTVLLLDFGAKNTDIAIAKNRSLVFSRSLPVGGDAITRSIAQGIGVDPVQADEYKKSYGLSPTMLEGKIGQVIKPVVGGIIDEIKKAIHFYQTEGKNPSPTSIILSGGSAGLTDLVPLMTKQLNIEVVVANPFAGLKIDPSSQKTISDYAPLYSVAVGLAEREV